MGWRYLMIGVFLFLFSAELAGAQCGDNNTTSDACINLAASEGLVYGMYGWLAAAMFPVGVLTGLIYAGGGRA